MEYYDERDSVLREHGSNGPQPSGEFIGERDQFITDAQSIAMEHGSNGPQPKQDFIGERDKYITDAQSIAMEHGSNGPQPTQSFIGELDPNRTEIQSILDEHGANSYVPKQDVYGTDDEMAIKIMRVFTASTNVNPEMIPIMVSKIPDETLYKVLGQRFVKSANIMSDRGISKEKIEELESRLCTDFAIISTVIEQDRNITDKKINASLYVGAKETDVSGLLKQYYISLLGVDKDIMLRGFNGEPITNAEGNQISAEDYLINLRKIVKEKKEAKEAIEQTHSVLK